MPQDGELIYHDAGGRFYAVGWHTYLFYGKGNYEIHSHKPLFRHKSRPREYLSYNVNTSGYRTRNLSEDGVTKSIGEHQLVFFSIFPELYHLKKKGYQVDHVAPHSKFNNTIDNLQLLLAPENKKKARDEKNGTRMDAAKKRALFYFTFEDLMANNEAHIVFGSMSDAQASLDTPRSIHGASFYGLQVEFNGEKYYVKVEDHVSNPFELWVCSDTSDKYTNSNAMVSNQGRTSNRRSGTATVGSLRRPYRKSGYGGDKFIFVHTLQYWAFYDLEIPEGNEVCHKDGVMGKDEEGCKRNLIAHLRVDTHENNMKERDEETIHEQTKLDKRNIIVLLVSFDDEERVDKTLIKRRRVR